jgi:hypothetical protein
MEVFLEAHPEGRWAATAWCHLGGLHLRELDGPTAEDAFGHALRLTSDDERDIFGRAIYGLAQAQEIQGRRADAIASLRRIDAGFEGTRYYRYARVALRRLSSAPPIPEPGDALPPLRLGNDVRTSAAAPKRDAPWLLVFFHADHPSTVDIVERLQQAWDPDVRLMIAIDLSGRRERCAEIARDHNWVCHTICADDGFLHHDALQLAISTTPSWFVVDRQGRLLARDIPADKLEKLLR